MMKQNPLVMIPGPTPVAEPIRQALAGPTYGHAYGPFVSIYKECLAGLKTIFQADHVVAIGGAGTLSMEMGLVNTVRAGEEVLVITQGYFGERFVPLAKSLGYSAGCVVGADRRAGTVDGYRSETEAKKYAAMTLTHVDTSTGVMGQVAEVAALAKKYDTLFILDGVCASAGIPEPMKELGIDVVITTSQKAFGAPPGLTIVAFNEKSLARREQMGTVAGYYVDWKNWLPIMDNPSLYFSTPPVNLIQALAKSVQMILEEGLEARYARHDRIARSFRSD